MRCIILQAADIDSLRNRLDEAALAPFREITPSGITLPAMFELACTFVMRAHSGTALVENLIEDWSQRLPEIGLVRQFFATGGGLESRVAPFDAPFTEFWPIRSRADWTDDAASLFQSRFARSLEKRRFGKKLSLALSKALQEMADNVVQHSRYDEEHPALGLVGYHVEEGWMTYAVSDIGRGIFASLRTNPKWYSLSDSRAALRAAIYERASRRIDSPSGGGFSQVEKSLADLNGILRFRTGDACLTLVGRKASRKAAISSNPYLDGFQLAVTCSLAVDNSVHPLPSAG
jgi:hypothetical protein